MKTQTHYAKKFSFEFFPPRSPEAEKVLADSRQRLAKLSPNFFSVTFGAGGSTRDKTLETAITVRDATAVTVAPHISCLGASEAEIRKVLATYRENGFSQLVVLRGDVPSAGATQQGPFSHANHLVEFIRKETGDYYHIDVACYPEFHPQANSPREDMDNFKRKIEAGANSAITQYFFNPYAYFHFIDWCQKLNIDIPIVPGIMPITNREQLVRFSGVCGAEIPLWILRRLEGYGEDLESIREFGLEVATELCSTLLEQGAPGLHIYSLNRYATSERLWSNLGLS